MKTKESNYFLLKIVSFLIRYILLTLSPSLYSSQFLSSCPLLSVPELKRVGTLRKQVYKHKPIASPLWVRPLMSECALQALHSSLWLAPHRPKTLKVLLAGQERQQIFCLGIWGHVPFPRDLAGVTFGSQSLSEIPTWNPRAVGPECLPASSHFVVHVHWS